MTHRRNVTLLKYLVLRGFLRQDLAEIVELPAIIEMCSSMQAYCILCHRLHEEALLSLFDDFNDFARSLLLGQ